MSPGEHLAEYLDRALPGTGAAGHGRVGVREYTVSPAAGVGGTVVLWNSGDVTAAIAALAVIDWHCDDITEAGGRPELRVRHRGADLCPAAGRGDGTRLLCARPRGHRGDHEDPSFGTLWPEGPVPRRPAGAGGGPRT
ncbi:hypothetical protein [Kitasatospora indigofera]|nr:hypothetical protein [Kitasatospora indigofera]